MTPPSVLQLIPLTRLDPHPLNANNMAAELRVKLLENVRRSGRYPPLIVRPRDGARFEILDGEVRFEILKELGQETAACCVWECDDRDALILLTTLNRLAGEDVPARRAALIAELRAYESLAELALLLPEDEAELERTLSLLDVDLDGLLERLGQESERACAELPVLFSFAVDPADAPLVQETFDAIEATLEGKNRHGRALVELTRRWRAPEARE